MLKNVKVSKLIEVLTQLEKESSLCNIEIDEDPAHPGIIFRAVRDPHAIITKTKIESYKNPSPKLNRDDLDKLII